MKKLAVILVVGLLLVVIVWGKIRSKSELVPDTTQVKGLETQVLPTNAPTVILSQQVVKLVNNQEYAYVIEAGIDPRRLKLIPNYSQKLNSADLMSQNNCVSGINGGFYGADDKPLGWVVVEGNQISRVKQSDLFNGFVMIDSSGSAKISGELNDVGVKYGLQTGPLLRINGMELILNMDEAKDKQARRMVLAQDSRGKMYFMSFFELDDSGTGPLMSQLPTLVTLVAEKENLNLVSAINLDGGKASAIHTSDDRIMELTPVGSWWCVTKSEGGQ